MRVMYFFVVLFVERIDQNLGTLRTDDYYAPNYKL